MCPSVSDKIAIAHRIYSVKMSWAVRISSCPNKLGDRYCLFLMINCLVSKTKNPEHLLLDKAELRTS